MLRRNNARVMHADRRHIQLGRRQDNPISSILGPSGIGILPGDDNPETSTDISVSPPVIATTSRTGIILSLPIFSPTTFPSLTPGAPDTTSSSESSTSEDVTEPNDTQTNSSSIATSTSTSRSSTLTTAPSSSIPGNTGQPTSNPTITRAAAQETEAGTQGFTSIITTSIDGSGVITITTVVGPSASLSAAPNNGGFFANQTQAAVVLTFVILVGLGLFSFLGYRFYKTVKRVQVERETEDLARSMRYRTRIDDEDDEDAPCSNEITQVNSLQPAAGGFEIIRGGNSARDSEDTNGSISIRRRVSSLDGLDANVMPLSQDGSGCYPVRPSMDSYAATSMRSKRSNTVGGSHSRSGTVRTTGSLRRSPTSRSSQSIHNYLHTEPFPPPITLPDSFGEDHPSTALPKPLEDDEDYQRTIPRVLKIANE